MDKNLKFAFGNTAYVEGCPPSMLDAIKRSGLSITMTGKKRVATTYEALTKYIRGTSEKNHDKTWQFLNVARNNVNTYKRRRKINEIIFSS